MSNKNNNIDKKAKSAPKTKKEQIIAYIKENILRLSLYTSIVVLVTVFIILLALNGKDDSKHNSNGTGSDNSQGTTNPGGNGENNSGGGTGGETGGGIGDGPEDDAGNENNDPSKTQFKSYSFDYFDTVSYIIGYETTGDEFGVVSADALDLLGEYHKLFDIYNEYDGIVNLCTINKSAAVAPLKVDQKIIDMLLYAKRMYNVTDGRMNIAMGSVLSIWHDYRSEGSDNPGKAQLPPMDKLTEASKHTNINDLIIDVENCTVYFRDPMMKLDVGAFAKGYAVEMVAKMLESCGKTNYVVNVGGNIRTTGTKANGDPWKTGVENPTGDYEMPYIEYLNLTDCAIVTSGSYQRYYIVNGKRYHHIIDPDTLMPSEKGFLSVSIVCKDSAMGDGLSTALFCMTLEEGMALINSLDGVEAMWYTTNETKHYSTGFSNFIAQ